MFGFPPVFRSRGAILKSSGWTFAQQRAVGAYLGLAIGDALGGTVEFMLPEEIRASLGIHDRIIGGGWLRLRPGQVTDDTEMSLALGAAILASGGRVTAEAAARAFDQWLRGKPIDVGNTVRRGIINYRNFGRTEMPEDVHDAGNGACMRTLPVALATLGWPWEEVVAASRAQAHVTHHNPLSDAATECVIRMVRMAIGNSTKESLIDGPMAELVVRHPEFRYRRKRPGTNPSAYIVDTIRVVFEVFEQTHDFETCLVEVVNRGGDADTTGAIAGMIAGALHGPEAIPERWLRRLEEKTKNQCISQALTLVDKTLYT
ncbi:MAG: ADP-ribosyl-[dinitrogen reductase] hydrolase [Magnetococcales bacterium]|nr:ADP-ribosyl-[dinitrogen reductase] hydrolase [Magnetococcales bacterium]